MIGVGKANGSKRFNVITKVQLVGGCGVIEGPWEWSFQGVFKVGAAGRALRVSLKMTDVFNQEIGFTGAVGIETGDDSFFKMPCLVETSGCFIHAYLSGESDTGVFWRKVWEMEEVIAHLRILMLVDPLRGFVNASLVSVSEILRSLA
jgi:hypothetical protein